MLKLTDIRTKIALNEKAESALQTTLSAGIDKFNVALRTGKDVDPFDAEDVAKTLKALAPVSQWLGALQSLETYACNNKLESLNDEQIRTAITKTRFYTEYVLKQNKDTGVWMKNTRRTKLDIVGMLAKLGVSLDKFKGKMSAVCCSISLIADKRMNKGAGKATIIANYGLGDIGNLESLKTVVQDAIDTFLPSSEYKATEEDAEFFYAIAIKMDKRKLCSVKAGVTQETYLGFFDLMSEVLNKDGNVQYKIATRDSKPEAVEYKTAEDAIEELAAKAADSAKETPAPVEEKAAAKEPKKGGRKPKAEKVA